MIAEQGANVVVIPVNAQVGQLNQLWLYKNGILGEDAKGLFTPMVVQASDADVELLLFPHRVQIVGRRPAFADGLALAAERTGRLINSAGVAVLGPLSGIGFNVQIFWSLQDHPHQQRVLERAFVKEGVVDHMSGDRQIGLSVQEQFDDFKLTTKFDHAQHATSGELGLAMDVNVHAELQDVAQANAFIARVGEFSAKIQERVTQFEADVVGAQS